VSKNVQLHIRVLLLFNHALDVKKPSGLQIIDFPTKGKGSEFTFGEVKIVGKGGRGMEVARVDKQCSICFSKWMRKGLNQGASDISAKQSWNFF
jgi:hypothetical protein